MLQMKAIPKLIIEQIEKVEDEIRRLKDMMNEYSDLLDRDAEHRRASDHAEQKSALELPEWYDMAEEFFNEIRVFSTDVYNELSGESILTQLRYAAEREAKAQISERSAGS